MLSAVKLFSSQTIKGKARRDSLLIFSFIVIAWVSTSIGSPHFFSANSIQSIFIQMSPLGFVVIGQMFVIISRGLDLSVASIMATTAVIAVSIDGISTTMIFLIGITLGVIIGLFNGYLIVKRGISPFLATLATMIILQGIRFTYTGGSPTGDLSEDLRFIATGSVLGIPISVIVLIVVAVLAHWILEYTLYGRQLSLYGENPLAARVSGYNETRLIFATYALSGILAAVAGLFLVGYVGIVDNWTGQGFDIDSIVAAVIGGVALKGGKGNVIGAILGALLLVSLFNIILVLGFSVEFQIIVKGFLILLAASIYTMKKSDRLHG